MSNDPKHVSQTLSPKDYAYWLADKICERRFNGLIMILFFVFVWALFNGHPWVALFVLFGILKEK